MSSTASTSGVKFSMFGAKSGFVIPKNKLSGSLVPTFQGGKTQGGGNAGNEHNTKQEQRKTKWGPDLTQDTSVKKGRALAYQQLESGTLEVETSRASALASQNTAGRSLDSQNNDEMVEHLELERREAIGEILKLNPRYKAPPDYKPLMREARVPIPVKEHPDFNFLNLIFGSQGETQKRLEKETGAKIQIFGAKTGGEKVEISSTGGNEIQTAWEELYFKISADTYEKVDAAITVIELLITSVSGNLEAGGGASASGPKDSSSIPDNTNGTAIDAGSANPVGGCLEIPQFQQYGTLATNQTPAYPPLDSSAPILGNPIPGREQAANSLNQAPFSGQQPSPAGQNQAPIRSPMQVPRAPELISVGFSGPPRTIPVPSPQASLAQPGFMGPLMFSGNQAQPMGPQSMIMRQSAPSSALQSVPSIGFRPRPLPDIISSNSGQLGRPLAPNFRPHQSGIEQTSFSFSSGISFNHQVEYPSGGSLRPMAVSLPGGRPSGPIPVNIPSFPSINQSTNAPPRPLQGDFTFQPQQPNIVRTPQGAQFPRPTFQPAAVNLEPQPFMQGFARPQHFGRPVDQPPSHLPRLFHGNPRSPNLQSFGPQVLQMRPGNFLPGAQFPDLSAPLPPRPVFRGDNPIPGGWPQNHQRFNTGRHQVYDPFSPTDG
ncbi:PREDICTED: branchpoint-bridging protein isoform X2 [Tarenaya hassleriana]|uniref:branchpoint-bridging protein isoform X2 n=1 Tax=Tarenaya hassleriana TaxID=28532 RepID=UPI00053C7728|nr:PREDICTED: branchpoint-bridging protein isoform X2 [Tarenaya hassleriana]